MGWRYRKNISLGGGFKINLSKSGIGYSWGFPGYRHTYSSNGSQRKTYSIPGTGISYVEENRKRNYIPANENLRYDENSKLITGDVKYFKNQNISSMGKDDELLDQINKLRFINILANICLISVVLLPIGILLKFLISKKWKIDLTYEMDDINTKKFESLNNFLIELSKNKIIWQIGSSIHVYNTKYNSGAGNNVTRHNAMVYRKMPWYISHNIDVYCLDLTDEKIYFTPDRMLIFKKMGGVGVRSYNDMVANFSWTNFVETEFVPRDSEIVCYTWTYVNKNGGPDKRFNNNRQIPICKYGEIQLQTEDGINIMLNISNHNFTSTIQDKFTNFMNYHNKILKMEKENNFPKEEESSKLNFEKALELKKLIDYIEVVLAKQNVQINDRWNNYNDDTNDIITEEIHNPVIVHQPTIQEKQKNEEAIKDNKILKTVMNILCYIQISFSAIICLSCISNKMILATICWVLITLIFIPRIKTILINKYPNIKSWIIIIRIISTILGFILIGITAPTE